MKVGYEIKIIDYTLYILIVVISTAESEVCRCYFKRNVNANVQRCWAGKEGTFYIVQSCKKKNYEIFT